ncbi:MAG TPA: aminomethyltransferase family protein [Candidatus Omnitrophota bacterium]|nr:aminomethyltransferase family protein [Candidatus Omnitrophota bacterium]
MNPGYSAVRNAVGLIDLTSRGKIRISGKDRLSFLHGILTQDIKNLRPGEGRYAALLDAEAHLAADFNVFAFDHHLLIDCQTVLTSKILRTFEKYLITEDVKPVDCTADFSWFGIEGPDAPELLARLTEKHLDSLEPHAHASGLIQGVPAEIFRFSFSGGPGFYLLSEKAAGQNLFDLILSKGKPLGIAPFGESVLQTLRIEAGIPWYGIDFDEAIVLPEIGLDRAVSRTKGCYLGQESAAKIERAGGPEKKLTGFVIETRDLPPLTRKIFRRNKEAGYLTSAVFSPFMGGNIALGYLQKNACPGEELELEPSGSREFLKIHSLPFFRRT